MPQAPAGMASRRPPSLYANLSGMPPQAPRIVISASTSEPATQVSQSGAGPAGATPPRLDSAPNSQPKSEIDHHCQICPTCGQRLMGHRCKLVCASCGYYMSCADYY